MVGKLHQKARTAFTLLELILAAGLTSVVLAVVMTSMTMFVNIERSSQQQLVSAELARNLLRQLEWDLRCLRAIKPADLISEDESETEALATALDPEAMVESLTEATPADELPVLVAGPKLLQLIIEPRINQSSAGSYKIAEQGLTAEDLGRRTRCVAWVTPGDEMWSAYEVEEEQGKSLVRIACVLDSQTDLIGTTEYLNLPELQSISFMYFDGEEWGEQWDSDENESLPKAIEVTIEIAGSQDAAESSQPKTEIYSRVIAIPGARFSADVEDVE
ncbi:MAG: prepilin-type N-terminal cleavage/methylation domain-containing protein [Planctomycetaceae bacterium]|nr:prepilin-type N-terminal cleavage/methylation domain-containing protein [Planctomycetaceae bacterium]